MRRSDSEVTLKFSRGASTTFTVLPICSDNYGPAMDRVAMLINQMVGPPCIPGRIGTSAKTGDPDCKVTSHTPDGRGSYVDKVVPFCGDNGNVPPCWSLSTGTTCQGQILNISWDPAVPAPAVSYDCAKCSADGLGCY